MAAILACLLIGGGVAVTELLGRYRAQPRAAIFSLPGLIYVAINAFASVMAYALLVKFDWTFGLSTDSTLTLVRVLSAGFGALALLRTNILSFTQGKTTVEAGPSAVLTILRAAVDRAVNQRQAAALIETDWAQGLSFERDHEALTLLCVTALIDPDERSARVLGDLAADLLRRDSMPDERKMLIYGIAIVEQLGAPPVAAAGRRLRARSQAHLDQSEFPMAPPVTQAEPVANSGQDATGATSESASRPAAALPGEPPMAVHRRAVAIESFLALTQEPRPPSKGADPRAWLPEWLFAPKFPVELEVNLRLHQAAMLERWWPALSAEVVDLIPYSTEPWLNVADLASGLFGVASRTLSGDGISGLALLRTLQPPPGTPEGEPGTWGPPRAWVYAFALYELWPYVSNELAAEALTASIEYVDSWDARAARAATFLRLGEPEAARSDLAVALLGRVEGSYAVIEDEGWADAALHPLHELLEDGLAAEAARALWNAAARAAHVMGTMQRPWPTGGAPLEPLSPRSTHDWQVRPAGVGADLAAIATTVAVYLPRRRLPPQALARDFVYAGSGIKPLPPNPSLLAKLHAELGDPTIRAPRTSSERRSSLYAPETI